MTERKKERKMKAFIFIIIFVVLYKTFITIKNIMVTVCDNYIELLFMVLKK